MRQALRLPPFHRSGLPAALVLGLSMSALGATTPGAAQDAPRPRPVALGTQANVALEASLFVEHERMVHGALVRRLEPAGKLSRGDRVVTLLSWYRLGGEGGFVVTNALPALLAWQPDDRQDEVSADGGRSWGHLGTLRLGHRLATAQDVTHIRWRISPAQALSGSGRIAYAGVVK
jgi:hypothetical protein